MLISRRIRRRLLLDGRRRETTTVRCARTLYRRGRSWPGSLDSVVVALPSTPHLFAPASSLNVGHVFSRGNRRRASCDCVFFENVRTIFLKKVMRVCYLFIVTKVCDACRGRAVLQVLW